MVLSANLAAATQDLLQVFELQIRAVSITSVMSWAGCPCSDGAEGGWGSEGRRFQMVGKAS